MHDVEHQTEQQTPVVEITDVQVRSFKPKQNGTMSKGSPRLPRAWKIAISGGIALLVLVIIFAGILSNSHQAAHVTSKPSSSSSTGANKAVLLPNPTTTPVQARASSGHNVVYTIADGIMYVGTTDNAVYALRMSNGTVLWRQKIDSSVDSQPFLLNGVVYVSAFVGQNGPGHVYALQQSDGSILWRYTSNGYTYVSPSDGDTSAIYIASSDGISALRAGSGTVLWHVATRGVGDDRPVVVNGVIYATSSLNGGPGVLDALRASDGTLLWQYQASSYISMPLISNGVAYINADNGILAALRASDGHKLWQRAIDTTFLLPLQLVDGVIYTAGTKISEPPAALSASPLQGAMAIGSLLWNTLPAAPAKPAMPAKAGQSAFYAIRASDGVLLWRYLPGNGGDSWASWFSVEHGIVYASTIAVTNSTNNNGDIYALQSNNGALIWHDALAQVSPFDGLLTNGVIYLGTSSASSNSVLYKLRASDGVMLWNYPVAGSSLNAPVSVGATLYAGATNGMIYALQANTGTIQWHYQTDVGV